VNSNSEPIQPSLSGRCSFSRTSVTAREANRSRRTPNSVSHKARGFSLIELMVVMSMIAIFLSIAIPTYSRSIVAARERALQSDLDLLRDSIWKYTLDKQKAP